jgi:hypothetical protein
VDPKQEEAAALNVESSSVRSALKRKSTASEPDVDLGDLEPEKALPALIQTSRSMDRASMNRSSRV